MGATDISESRHSSGDDTHKRMELAKWLSDWHLVAFLGTTGLFSEVGGILALVWINIDYVRRTI